MLSTNTNVFYTSVVLCYTFSAFESVLNQEETPSLKTKSSCICPEADHFYCPLYLHVFFLLSVLVALSFICVYVFPSSLVILCFYFTLLNFFLSFYFLCIPLLPIFSLSSSFLLLAPFSSFHIPLLVLLFLNSSLLIYFTFYRHLSLLFLTPYLFLLPFSLFSFLIHRFLHLFSRHSPPSPSPLSYLAHNSISTFLTFPIFFLCYLSLQLFYLPTFPSLHKFFTALASPSFPLQSLLLTPDPAPLSGPYSLLSWKSYA